MRPIRLVAVLSMLVPLLVVGPPVTSAAASATAAEATKVMIVGDSITHGAAGDYTWRYRLGRHLTDSGVAVDFVGPNHRLYDQVRSSPGSFVESDAYADPAVDSDHNARWGRFLGAWPGYPGGAEGTIRTDVEAHQPQYVIVMLGLTDLFWFRQLDPVLVVERMANFVRNAREGNPDVRLVLVAVQPTLGAQQDAVFAARIANYNQQLSALAAAATTTRSPIAYVQPAADFQPDYGQTPHDSYDGTHPNARGEIRIADAVGDVLSAQFGFGPPYPLVLADVPIGPVLDFTLRCSPGDSKATLTWDESPGATGYWFQRRTAGGTWSEPVHQLTLADQPLDNIYLFNGVVYEYRLQAATMYDKGVYSNVCTVTPSGPVGRMSTVDGRNSTMDGVVLRRAR
jgi:hypothetical protein